MSWSINVHPNGIRQGDGAGWVQGRWKEIVIKHWPIGAGSCIVLELTDIAGNCNHLAIHYGESKNAAEAIKMFKEAAASMEVHNPKQPTECDVCTAPLADHDNGGCPDQRDEEGSVIR
jgi:hypothetical protein